MAFSFLLAWRLIQGASQERTMSRMLKLCFWAITISTAALALVSAIMIGFEKTTYEKIKGINADLTIKSPHRPLNYEALRTIISRDLSYYIQEITPTTIHTVLIKRDDDAMPHIVFLHALDVATFEKVSTLAQTLSTPENESFAHAAHHGIIVGKEVAQLLSLTIGQNISLLVPSEKQKNRTSLAFDTYEAPISGIFSTGLEDLDSSVAFCSLEYAAALFEEAQDITGIALKVQPNIVLEDAQKAVEQKLGVKVTTWKESYVPLVEAMRLETYAMIIMLSLMVAVAMISITALLLLYITYKKNTIAILLAMGASRRLVRNIFLILGLTVTTAASIVATASATFIAYMLNTYKLISLPNVYYVSHVPAAMSWTIILSVSALTITLGCAALWYALSTINTLPIARVLRFEF